MSVDDQRLFAAVVAARSFTGASAATGLPKQTLSRRVAALEARLGVRLLHRTTRRVQPTEVGRAYAERCAEIARLSEEADRAVTDTRAEPSGVLRVTADPVFGEAFLAPLLVDYARRWPAVGLDLVLTRRRVDLVEEGLDVAFRVGAADDPALSAVRLGPARIRYCAAPAWVAAHGRPDALEGRDCVVVSDGGPTRWPTRRGPIEVRARLRTNGFAVAHAAVLAGLGIGLYPSFACAEDLAAGRLVAVLDEAPIDVGAVWLLHPPGRYLSARVRAFVDLAVASLAHRAWDVPG